MNREPQPVGESPAFWLSACSFLDVPDDGDDIHNTIGLIRNTNLLQFFPPFHMAGLFFYMLTAILDSSLVVNHPAAAITAEHVINIINQGVTTSLGAADSILTDLSRTEAGLEALSKLDKVIYGGGPLSPQTGNIIAPRVKNLSSALGLTENGLMHCIALRGTSHWDCLRFNTRVGYRFEEVSPGVSEFVISLSPKHRVFHPVSWLFPDLEEYRTQDFESTGTEVLTRTKITNHSSAESIKSLAKKLYAQLLNSDEGAPMLDDDDNVFELGMDSLQVVVAVQKLKAALRSQNLRVDTSNIGPHFFYTAPSSNKRARAIDRLINGVNTDNDHSEDVNDKVPIRQIYMQAMIDKYTTGLDAKLAPKKGRTDNLTVVLTGSTGSLGSYVLHSLIKSPQIAKVVCFNRSADAQERQTAGNKQKNLLTPWDSPDTESNPVEFLTADLSKPDLALNWMQKNPGQSVLETIIHDLDSPEFLGYGESKYISERLVEAHSLTSGYTSSVMRVGQIAGPVLSTVGIWNVQKWFPSLLASSKHLGLLPDSLGTMSSVNWVPVDVLARIIVQLVDQTCNTHAEGENDKKIQTEFEVTNLLKDSSEASSLRAVSSHWMKIWLKQWAF
ncbi:hypothetical protein TSTA_030400 [Talaromyces stipitatus ATCC 10500]|uniref:Carrier domain-containing protein n=1 Tax=Talaromyces stipitatus (strain ATCC 10500 / CBS 375.48 / QM 6759 / NRRL 1006) TaxID=441959 RepID=B8M5G7_TALSN|nr:uncharacterized protein TSTA_030400 [Talaromyces stipitatus ATCC 10500]EED19773.1 hypothetical protein TSTA_030400 [Talaromyces stipitatus ATCC 10500]